MYLKQLAFQKLIIITSFFAISCSTIIDQNVTQTRPNILFFITDDQSWIHNSFAGEQAIKTPGFDCVARAGIYFENAFCAAPSCSPSRGAIITGQEIWRLGEAAQLFLCVIVQHATEGIVDLIKGLALVGIDEEHECFNICWHC